MDKRGLVALLLAFSSVLQTGQAIFNLNSYINSIKERVLESLKEHIDSTVRASIASIEAQNRAQLLILRTALQAADTAVLNKLSKIEDRLAVLESNSPTLSIQCNITGPWRRVAYLNTAEGDPCPAGLNTHNNADTNQRACGRSVDHGCSSVGFHSGGSYSQVCGRVRGYQDDDTEPFDDTLGGTIDDPYLSGVSITHGSPRQHLWSYVSAEAELHRNPNSRCPCAALPNNLTDSEAMDELPSFVGDHYYCESGYSSDNNEDEIAWGDPLWDGDGCTNPENKCCNRFGWFHRQVPSSDGYIELRWCGDGSISGEDVVTDQFEIWVM